jgi:alkylhydroperoxidase/carboxymuconolactone decarboxylase family protein YurZ
VARISYVDVDELGDAELREYMEQARQFGTPRPETQAIRSHVPAVARAFSRAWDRIFRRGVLEHSLKELCRVYVSLTIECNY